MNKIMEAIEDAAHFVAALISCCVFATALLFIIALVVLP